MCPASCSAARREQGLAGGAGRTPPYGLLRERTSFEKGGGGSGLHPLNSHRYLCLSQRGIMHGRISSTEMF